jgi:hypothetical protein
LKCCTAISTVKMEEAVTAQWTDIMQGFEDVLVEDH